MATWCVIWDLGPKICQGEQLRVPGAEARLGREKKGSQRGSSEDGAVHFDQCLPLSRVGADQCPCVTLLHPTGEGPGCGTACGSHSCPEGFCSNGGRCHLHPSSCAPTCLCPPAFTDQRCLVAGGDFQPPASPGGCPCPVPRALSQLGQPWDTKGTAVVLPCRSAPEEREAAGQGAAKRHSRGSQRLRT